MTANTNTKYKKASQCRVCGNPSMKKVIDLGAQHLQGSFIKEGKELPPMDKIPCTLLWCDAELNADACGLLQMEHSVDPNLLYEAYWYRSGTNNTMRNHLKSIVNEVLELKGGENIRNVLDIGCNDGTLLDYYDNSIQKYGVDPSDVAQEVKNAKVVQDIFPSPAFDELLAGNKLDVITSIAMFYDLEDPVSFAKSIQEKLNEEGLWVFEMSYMPTMLAKNSYDTICHEHLEYYHLEVLEYILAKAGLKLAKISFNDINGGSIRCLVTHAGNTSFDIQENFDLIEKVRQEEKELGLRTPAPYFDFQRRIEIEGKELYNFLKGEKDKGKQIHIYGASTKGNTILQWCGIDNSIILYAAERNPDKYGARTLGTNIEIISEADSRAMKPDYYLVLPWHFKDEFVEREKETMEQGAKLIFPLPKFEIIGADEH